MIVNQAGIHHSHPEEETEGQSGGRKGERRRARTRGAGAGGRVLGGRCGERARCGLRGRPRALPCGCPGHPRNPTAPRAPTSPSLLCVAPRRSRRGPGCSQQCPSPDTGARPEATRPHVRVGDVPRRRKTREEQPLALLPRARRRFGVRLCLPNS